MPKPVLLAVDNDPHVLAALEADLRARYGGEYAVVGVESGAAALALLRVVHERRRPVALVIADQRMPAMTGAALLRHAREITSHAKRVLLIAYGQTDSAIEAINAARIDHFLIKPWHPAAERLYPALDELLEDWRATYRHRPDELQVIGHRWSPGTHDLKDFLARNQVPYRWQDLDSAAEARALVAARPEAALPWLVFPDGTVLENPDPASVAARLGLATEPARQFYDLIIAGGGPAGLGAGVYGASEGLNTVMIECEAPGGQAGTSSHIDNYLGFPAGISGAELARRAVAQAERFGTELLVAREVVGISVDGPYRVVKLANGEEIACFALLIATGVAYRRLDAPGVERLTGAGVYYGASTTEAATCTEQDVYVVGGANSAGQAAVYFAKFARTVTMLVRGPSLSSSMSQYLIDEIARTPNIRVWTNTVVTEVSGESRLAAIAVRNTETGETRTLPTESLFILIGAEPHTEWLAGVLERDAGGYLCTGRALLPDGERPAGWPLDRDPYLLETSVPGIFAAGDVRQGSVKRVASAVGEGSMAVQFIHQYLESVR